MTMAFTYFFRDSHTLYQIARHVIPEAVGRNPIRVWDAGCAMGPEPFSLAILFAENLGAFAFKNLRIDASDIDESHLFERIIIEGVYSAEELGRLPPHIFEKYFQPSAKPGHFRISETVRNRVAYRRHDLLSLRPIGDNYHLVVCKNVLLHFQAEQRVEVLRMFHRALAAGGFLVLEQTQKLPAEVAALFQPVTADAQLFRKAEAAA